MENKEKRPAEMEAPTGTVTITLPDYNTFSGEEQEKAVKVVELLWMALQVNGLSERDSNKNHKNILPAMLFDYAGHVFKIAFRCYINGYKYYGEYEEENIRLDTERETFLKRADHIKRWLRGILEGMKHDA